MDCMLNNGMKKGLKLVFMGTPEFAAHILKALLESDNEVVGVVTVADKPAGRGQQIQQSAVKKVATAFNIPILQPEKLKDEAFLSALQSWGADLFVVVAFRMLPQAVWAMPTLGTINLHASLLPKYRGAAPINWAIINGEKETGVTTFFINERIDTGEILLQEKIDIHPSMTAGELHDSLMELGAQLTVRTVNLLANHELSATPQDEHLARQLPHAPKIFKQDCLIDWNSDAQKIVHLIRGLSPYPGAITYFIHKAKNQRVQFKLFAAFVSEQKEMKHITHSKDAIFIPCQKGIIAVSEWQQEGKRRMSVKEWLVGNNMDDWRMA
jgi:methionyl-tRNA formyltransferase